MRIRRFLKTLVLDKMKRLECPLSAATERICNQSKLDLREKQV